MTFVECKPTINQQTGELHFPTHNDYIKTYTGVVQTSFQRRYFGCYYTGMTEIGTGNWVTLPDKYKIEKDNELCEPSDEVEFISQNDLGKIAIDSGYYGYVWFSLDCPQGGNWVLQMYKEYKLYKKSWTNVLMDSSSCQYNIPDYFCYITRLKDRKQNLWNRSAPMAFNNSF